MIIVSCHKKEDPKMLEAEVHSHSDVAIATITLNGISNGDTIEQNTTANLMGSIAGTTDLHGYSLKLINIASGDLYIDTIVHEHAASYSFNKQWTNTLGNTAELKWVSVKSWGLK
jgi:hypothetical protein